MAAIRKWGWAWFAAGIAIIAISITASAEDGAAAAGPNWRDIAFGAVAMLVTMIGWWGKTAYSEVRQAITKNETHLSNMAVNLSNMREMVLSEYHNKEELREIIQQAMAPLLTEISALNRRFDGAGFPSREHIKQERRG